MLCARHSARHRALLPSFLFLGLFSQCSIMHPLEAHIFRLMSSDWTAESSTRRLSPAWTWKIIPLPKKKHKKSWNIQCAVSPYFPRKKMERKTKLRAGLSPYFIFLSLSETFHEIIALCPVSRFPAAGLLRHGRGAVRHHWQSSTNLVRKPRGNWVVDSPSSSSFYFDFIQHNEMLVVFSLYTFFPMFVDLRRVTLSAA